MAPYEIDIVKVEKANAMRRYNRRRTVKWIVELCAVLFVLSLSTAWLPFAVETAREFFRPFISVFDCTFYVFILVMAIIFILYALSGEKEAGSDPYDEFLKHNQSIRKFAAGDETPTQAETDSSPAETFHDKQIVCSDNAASPVHDDRTVSSIPSDRVAAVTEKALREKRYRRTKSEKFELRIVERSRRELRRSETEICRKLVRPGEEPARRSFSYSVEELSNEEFNRTVDAYIADKKKILRQEYKEERRTETSFALTTQNRASAEQKKK